MKTLSLAHVRHALIIAPHPDDETIGAFGMIRALRLRSARVRVVIVTDGAGSHPASNRWPRTRLIAARRRESLMAMRRIGVAAGDVAFLGLADGGLSAMPARVGRRLHRAVARCRPDLIVLPARDDDHPDHRAIAVALARTAARRLEYLVWPHRQTPSRQASHGLRLDSTAPKRGAIRRYRTQMGAITDDPGGFAISRRELAGFARPVEQFRAVWQ